MGWFKRVFGGSDDDEPDEIIEETVELSGLSDWVELKSNSGFEKIRPEIEDRISKLFAERRVLKTLLKELAFAELHNPDIPDRERQIMEGNRTAYISQHKQFINNIDISEDAGCSETTQFCKDFEEMLLALAKSTAKGHAIMGAFFANYASKINKSIKTMGDIVSRMKEILEDGNVGVEHIDDVQKAVAALKGKKKLLAEMEEELEIFRKKLANSRQMKAKIEKNIDQLKQTGSYTQFREANQQREELWKKAKQAEEDVEQMFSPLSRAMKKYERMIAEHARLLLKYMDEPIKALAEDEDLVIIGIMAKMKSSLVEGTLELKDAEKVAHRVEEVTREKLSAARDAYVESRASIKKIDDIIRNSGVLNELNDLQYKIEHVDNQLKILRDKIEKSEKTKEKIDLESLRDAVVENVKEAFGVEVTITWEGSQAA